MENIFRLLQLMDEAPRISQRELAKQSGLSLGSVNALVAELQEKNLIHVEKQGHSSVYQITGEGGALLRRLMLARRQHKLRLKPLAGPVRTAVILAAGRQKDFPGPVCLLPLPRGGTLLARSLSILRENGVEEIIVVGGYALDALREALSPAEQLVENPQYRFTGTMTSLAAAAPLLKGKDFLLLEGDLVYERQLIPKVLENDTPSCIVTANVSGSGDEAYVEEDALGDLVTISMDLRQLNRISGEMIGVSKISAELFDRMMETFAENENPFFNYEYLLANLAHLYRIRCLRVDDLSWGEVDNNAQYQHILSATFPTIVKREEVSRLHDAQALLRTVFSTQEDLVLTPAGGMTNSNYRFQWDGCAYILRIPYPSTASMIDRRQEAVNNAWASEAGLNAETLYFDPDTGIKVTRCIPEAETLLNTTARLPGMMQEIAALLRRLHTSGAPLAGEFSFLAELERYEEINRRLGGFWPEDYAAFRAQVMTLRRLQERLYAAAKAPCHNDLVAQNLVRGKDRLYLIDWEYAGMNDPAWDLASYLQECEHTPEEADYFLSCYDPDADLSYLRDRIQIQMVYQDLLWSVWTWAKEAGGNDYGTYGADRYRRCHQRLAQFRAAHEEAWLQTPQS